MEISKLTINHIEKLQEERFERLESIAKELNRYMVTYNNPHLSYNLERSREENNNADAEYVANY
jgi:hypothetical protein